MFINVTNLLDKCAESLSFRMDFSDVMPTFMELDEMSGGSLSPLREDELDIQLHSDSPEPELSITGIMKELSTINTEL